MDLINKLLVSHLLAKGSKIVISRTLDEWEPINTANNLEIVIYSEIPFGRLLWVYLEHAGYTLAQANCSLLGTPTYLIDRRIIPAHQKRIENKLQEIGQALQTVYTDPVRAWTTIPRLKEIELEKPTFPRRLIVPDELILFSLEEMYRITQELKNTHDNRPF